MKENRVIFLFLVYMLITLGILWSAIGMRQDMFWIISTLIVCIGTMILMVFYFINNKMNIELWKQYLILGLLMGVVFVFAIPTYMSPDEPVHLYKAYSISNSILGIESEPFIKMRMDDYAAEQDGIVSTMQYDDKLQIRNAYNNYYKNVLDLRCDDASLIELKLSPISYDSYMYYISAFGITIGRMASLGTIPTYILGEVLNMFFFVALFTLSIYLTPVGKEVFFVIGLIPITLQQCVSFSCDAFLIPIGALTIALTFNIIDKLKHNGKMANSMLMWFLLVFFLVPAKRFLCAPMLLLAVLFLTNSNNVKVKKMVVCGTILVVVIILLYIKVHYSESAFMPLPQDAEMHYSIGYVFLHPLEIIRILINTFTFRGSEYVLSFLGTYPGWMNLSVPIFFTLCYLACLFIAVTGNSRQLLSKGERLLLMTIVLMLFGIIFAGMLLGWTLKGDGTIDGVQGRYFVIPILLLLSSISLNKVTIEQGLVRCIYLIMPLMNIMYVAYIYAYIGWGT